MAQRRRNIEFAAPDEPTFLKKMKAEIGYQKRDTIETKVGLFLFLVRLCFNLRLTIIFLV